MILGAASLARAAWDMAGRAMTATARWLRKPRDWWRFIAVTLALVCLFAAWAVRDARQQVLVVTERCNAQVVTIQAEAKAATTTAADNRRALLTCKKQLADEVGNRQAIEQLGREAVADAQRAAERAHQGLLQWQADYARRPATCQAALEALEVQCDTITEY